MLRESWLEGELKSLLPFHILLVPDDPSEL
jgi:hypothetical protein